MQRADDTPLIEKSTYGQNVLIANGFGRVEENSPVCKIKQFAYANFENSQEEKCLAKFQ